MKKVILFILFTFGLLRADTIQLYTEDLPPYQYQTTKLKGITVSIVRELLKSINHPDTIELTSWNRAYNTVQAEKNVAIFPASRTPQREKLFKWVGPIFRASNRFIAHTDSNIKLNKIDDVKKIKTIGVVSNSSRHLLLKDQGFKNLIIHYDNNQNYRALFNKRIDLIVANPVVAEFQVKSLGSDSTVLQDTGIELYHSDVYIIFNPQTSDSIITTWQTALDELVESGAYQQIFDRSYQQAQKDFGIGL